MRISDSDQIRVYHRCGGCGNKQEFVNSGNLTIHERTKPGRIPTELFETFLDNDADTAMAYGRDIVFLKRNNAELSIKLIFTIP